MIKFRDLTADEIDVRVGMCKDNGLTLLLYKDARCDMNILDETVGAENWQREHYECKGNLFCKVGIKYEGEWIWKADCGTESNTEKEKGESSDSFKRSCVCHGIGRELYTSPFIWIKAEDCKIKSFDFQGKKKYKCDDKFVVEKIVVTNKRITAIAIRNATLNKRVFVWQESK